MTRRAAAVLEKKRAELMADMARLKGEAADSGRPEVRDEMDGVTADQSTGEALEEVAMESATLEQVEDALRRVGDGTYGTCWACGRPISAARLAAVPWTPFCIEHASED